MGHRKIAHGVDTRKTVPDELGKRLGKMNRMLESLVFEHVIDDFVHVAKGDGRSVQEAYLVMRGSSGYEILRALVDLYGENYMGYRESLHKEVEKLAKVES